jgi:hypothetical protein
VNKPTNLPGSATPIHANSLPGEHSTPFPHKPALPVAAPARKKLPQASADEAEAGLASSEASTVAASDNAALAASQSDGLLPAQAVPAEAAAGSVASGTEVLVTVTPGAAAGMGAIAQYGLAIGGFVGAGAVVLAADGGSASASSIQPPPPTPPPPPPTPTLTLTPTPTPKNASSPNVAISHSDAGTRVINAATGEVLYTFTFSAAVTGFTADDITVANGTKGTFTQVSDTIYTLAITAQTGVTGNLTVDVAAGSATDAGGHLSTAALQSVLAIDTLLPTARITVADPVLAAGHTSLVTITFSEAVNGFTNADLTIGNGTLSPVSTADGGTTWTATLTPATSTTSTTNVITLASASVTDAAGNPNSGTTTSNNYAVNTVAPSVVITDDEPATGNIAGGDIVYTFTFSEVVSGFTIGDITVANGVKGTFTALSSTVYTLAVTPTAGFTGNVTVDVDLAVAINATGNNNTAATQSVQPVDMLAPTATIVVADNNLIAGETSLVTITFNEAVTGFTNAELKIGNGILSPVSTTDGGITWTATLTPATSTTSTTNVITLASASVADTAGNPNSGTTSSNNYAVDTATPTIAITDDEPATGNIAGGDIVYTFTFSEAVTGFTIGDITVANGTKGTFTAVSSTVYTLVVTPTAGFTGNVTVDVGAAVVIDAAGNPNTAATQSVQPVDMLAPTATIIVANNALATGDTSLVTIAFNEAVTGFNNADLTIANGTLSTVSTADGGITWTATLTPATNTTSTANVITLASASITDAAGNPNSGVTSSNNYAVDTTAPSVVITDDEPATGNIAGGNIVYTFTFSEAVTGFTIGDITVANATKGTFTVVSPTVYTLAVTPAAGFTGNVTVDVGTAIATDAAGNDNTAATQSVQPVDMLAPTAIIVVADNSLLAGETSLVTITFNEAVTGFTNSDLTIGNGTLSTVSTADGGITWTATLIPATSTTSTTNVITLASTSLTDTGGNPNSGTTSSNNYAVNTVAPSVVITDDEPATGNIAGGDIVYTFTFSEAVTGFTIGDITVANGTKGTFTPVSSTVYTLVVAPTAGFTGNVTVDVGAAVAIDASGNNNTAATQSVQFVDTLAPTATIVVADTSLTAGETCLVTITFSEAVTGLTNADLTIGNGTLSTVSTADGGITWTATLTPATSTTSTTNVRIAAQPLRTITLSIPSRQAW